VPLRSSNRTCGFPASGSPEQVASSMRRRWGRALVEQHQSETLEVFVPAHAFWRTIRPLTAPLQVPDQTVAYEPVDLPPGPARITVAEVIRPASQVPIQPGRQLRQRGVTLTRMGHRPQLLPLPGQRVLRRKHIQISGASASLTGPVLAKRVSQKIQAFPPYVPHTRLLAMDLQSELAFQLRLHVSGPFRRPLPALPGEPAQVRALCCPCRYQASAAWGDWPLSPC
jgi:hypothetical protein